MCRLQVRESQLKCKKAITKFGTSLTKLRKSAKQFNTKEKLYCLAVWTEEWSELQKSKKEWIIFKCLYSISPSLDGKIRAVDVQDYGFILEYFIRSGFGPYWETKDDLPSLLDSNDGLPLIIPLED